jgi:hypothetical protein
VTSRSVAAAIPAEASNVDAVITALNAFMISSRWPAAPTAGVPF